MMLFFFWFQKSEGGMLRQNHSSYPRPGWSIAASDVSALELGRLNVTTALGQPLVAEVDLSVAPGDDVDSIRVNVASPAVYRAANVEYRGVLQTVRAQVLRRPNGTPYVRLASSQSINDPYLDILLGSELEHRAPGSRICVPAGPSGRQRTNH